MKNPEMALMLLLAAMVGCAAGNVDREDEAGACGEKVVVVSSSGRVSAAGNSGLRFASAGDRDCDEEQVQCFRWCWQHRVPWPHGLSKDARYRFCQAACLAKYMECLGAKAAQRTFSTLAAAMAWLNEYPNVAVGAVVITCAGLFVVATDGAGALILVPLAERSRF